MNAQDELDTDLDLVFERFVDVPVDLVWKAWTQPEHVVKWFTPKPWQTVECEIDLRPGGVFRSVMRSPEGEDHSGLGCFIEVIEPSRLVFTDALLPGYRPAPEPFFTTILSFEPLDGGTNYRAIARHGDAKARERHEEMGFHKGWGAALDQLVEHAATM